MVHPVPPAPEDAASSVTRVVRVSRSLVEGSVMAELFGARARVSEAHRAAGLCAALQYCSGWFVLWIEGAAAAVHDVLDRSATHACHAEPRVIHRSTGPATLVEPITVGVTQWPESVGTFRLRIEAVEDTPGLAPGAIWRLLSEPCTLPGASLAGSLERRRVALLSPDDHRSIDEVRRLADRFGRPVVYQRFAGGEPRSREVGGAYVDLSFGGEPVRVQVVSHRALDHALVRESLGAVHRLALLLGSGARAAVDLAAGLAALLATGAMPVIDLITASPEVADLTRDVLASRIAAPLGSHITGGPDSVLRVIAQIAAVAGA